ncbi:S1 family peptidase [Actinomadura fulvescens]
MRRWLAVSLMPGLVAAATVVAPPPATADGEQQASATIVLARQSQPVLQRPALDGLKHAASREGITLERAIDRHVTKVTSPRSGRANGDTLPDIKIDDLPLAELVDLRLIARTERIGLAEAIDRFSWQPRFQEAADQLRKDLPWDLAGASISDDGMRARFAFKGKVPVAAVRLARTLPTAVELIGGTGYSEADLDRVMNTAHAQVAGQGGFTRLQSSYDTDRGLITIEAQRPKGYASTTNAPAVPRSGNSNIKIEVKVTQLRPVRPADRYIRGGGLLNGCTAGFPVKRIMTRETGISTAGHCASRRNTYRNHRIHGGSTGIARKRTHQGASGDIAWYSRGKFSPSKSFYYDWNKSRWIHDRSGMPGKGTRICKFGRTTGASCAKVRHANVTVSSGGRTYQHMVIMNGGGVRPGDSGGPWYYGNRAFGITHGYVGGTSRSVFTPAYLLQNLGVDVYER